MFILCINLLFGSAFSVNVQLGQILRARHSLAFPSVPAGGAVQSWFHWWESAALVLSQAFRDSSHLNTSLSTNVPGCLRQQWRPQKRADSGRRPDLGSSAPTISPIWLLCLSKHTVPGNVGTDLNHTLFWIFLFRLKTSLGDVEMGILGPWCPSVSWQHSFTYFIWSDHQGGFEEHCRDQKDSSDFWISKIDLFLLVAAEY